MNFRWRRPESTLTPKMYCLTARVRSKHRASHKPALCSPAYHLSDKNKERRPTLEDRKARPPAISIFPADRLGAKFRGPVTDIELHRHTRRIAGSLNASIWISTATCSSHWFCEDIGLAGFEPAASCTRGRRSTKLSHSPKSFANTKASAADVDYFAYSGDTGKVE